MIFILLLLLLTMVPLLELALFVQLYKVTDLLTTLSVVLLTGIIGAALARQQGLEVWYRIQEQLSKGKPPARELMDGLMILIAGTLLITPGMMTDVIGFLLLTPPVRALLRGWLVRRIMPGRMQFYSFTSSPFSESKPPGENEIEAEYTVEREGTDSKTDRLPDSSD